MATHEQRSLELGDTVYTEDGTELGTVRGFDDNGFYVSANVGIDAPMPEHVVGAPTGESNVMWRCWQCGEMGKIDDIPDECPDCGAGAEELYYWTED